MSISFWIAPIIAALVYILGNALFKYLQGEFNQGLSIEYRQQRVNISPSQSLILIEVEACNTSKIPVNIRYMEATLRRLSRYTDEEVSDLYRRSFPTDGSPLQPIPWEQIFVINRHWEERTCTIQPDERHYESFEFIIPGSYDTIPIRVEIQFVNKPLQEDLTFWTGAVGWKRIGIIEPIEDEEVE